jgi:hypothetical protein
MLQFHASSFGPGWWGEMVLLFSAQTLTGTGFIAVGCREAFHRLGIQDATEFDSE